MAVFNILHKKAKFVIVPYAALTPNFPLPLKGDTLAFHDGYNAEVIDACEIHLVNAEQMILKHTEWMRGVMSSYGTRHFRIWTV